mmetsp:Transcript_12989/g.30753  ORF Transcript_12989/g.30753 Transcript_12989/m.30753 type:complete len:750 (-) Transcript_12989:61-2310(-)
MTEDTTNPARKRLIKILKECAAKVVSDEDPWGKYEIEKIPAERVIRHLYQPLTKTWTMEETIVKMENEPFTHGAMRFCYRMKKMATPPASSSNHRFHSHGWKKALNYVSKAYQVDGKIDTSEDAKNAVRNDILLQYEASHWAKEFNDHDPPKKINFIRAYALEFPEREGSPMFAVERFISGTDAYGVGFFKHNTNAGFVDEDLHRVTPQVFSAYSFYESSGTRLVADIQGVGDLYTDPQVLSNDYRFGDGDLGPRGMALFFETFRHNTLAESLGIPVFPLSKNELKHQAKYEDDVYSLSGENSSFMDMVKGLDKFAAMDANRNRRQSLLIVPPLQINQDDDDANTETRSNMTKRDQIRKSLTSTRISKPVFARSGSEMDEVKYCLDLAKKDFKFDSKAFGRKASGEMIKRKATPARPSLMIRHVSEMMVVNDETKLNLGKVHYQLAVLHGMNRFPDVVPVGPDETKADVAPHDAFSVLFHLSHAASLKSVAACLALGRLHAGLGTSVSELLDTVVPIDFDAAKDLFRRCIESKYPPAAPKAAAGCLLYQMYLDDRESQDYVEGEDTFGVEIVSDITLAHLLEDILKLIEETNKETAEAAQHTNVKEEAARQFKVGDRVEGNFAMEGSFYPGEVTAISEDGKEVEICYDDDGSKESLTLENVRLIIPPTATQTVMGGPLSDEEALGSENTDEKCVVETYELKGELAALKLKLGSKEAAAALFEEASNDAMNAGKMKKASEWSLKAAELME